MRGGALHLLVMDELVHSPWPEGGADGVNHCHAGVDVADQLGLPLAGVRALLEQDNLGLLWVLGGAVVKNTSASTIGNTRCLSYIPPPSHEILDQ